jgi:hypothetical protein
MSRPRPAPHRSSKKLTRGERHKEQVAEATEHFATILTCSVELASNLAARCEDDLSFLDRDLSYNALAVEFWATPPASAQAMAETLRELYQSQQRHREVVARARVRLEEFAAQELHEHLRPIDPYQTAVRERFILPAVAADPDFLDD